MKKSVSQYQALLSTVRPRDLAGKTRRRMAAEELEDLHRLDAKLKSMKAELKTAVLATGSHLMDIHGIGPAGAARILADVADIARFPERNHFASWTGTASIDASSGQHLRHRLSRAGNRRLNHVLYIAGIVQLRNDTAGRAYYRRKLAAGKTPMEAMRCLRRRLSDAVYRQLAADALAQEQASPGGHPGASLISSAAGLSPDTGTSFQPLPGPAPQTLPPPPKTPKAMAPAAASTRRRARGVNVERPTGFWPTLQALARNPRQSPQSGPEPRQHWADVVAAARTAAAPAGQHRHQRSRTNGRPESPHGRHPHCRRI